MRDRECEILAVLCEDLLAAEFRRDGYRVYSDTLYLLGMKVLDLARHDRLFVKNDETNAIEKVELVE